MDDKVTNEAAEYKYTDIGEAPTIDIAPGEPVGTDTATASVAGNTNLFAKLGLKNIELKRFVRPILVVSAILLVYSGISFYSKSKARSLEQQKLTMQDNARLVTQQQIAMVEPQPVVAVAPANLEIEASSAQIAQIQSAVQKNIDSVAQQFASEKEGITNIKEKLAKTEQEVLNLNQKIDQLTAVMQQMFSDIEQIKSAPKKVVKKFIKPVAYHIRAIVPGRVWLESETGKSVTLRVGDKLEGYGVVRAIAPRQGMVVMSNGSIIQYGVGDF